MRLAEVEGKALLRRHRLAVPKSLLLAPGVLFSPRQATSSKLRVPVAMADLVTPWEILESLLNQLRK